MKITLPNFKNKLLNGWELLTSDNKAFKVLPTDDIKVTVHTGNKITVSTIDALSGCLHSKRVLKEITPVALRHPKNHSRCIAIDQVVVPKQTKPEKTKIKIIVGDRHNACDQILAMYAYYKAMRAKGSENVEIVSYKWEWVDGSPIGPFKELVGDTTDTEIICCGFEPSAVQLTTLKKFTLIPNIRHLSKIDKKISTILNRLKALSIYPELSLQDEKDKLCMLMTGGNYVSDAPETLAGFLNKMLAVFTPETCSKLLKNPKSKFFIRQAMDIFMDSDFEVGAYKAVADLPLFAKNKELKNATKSHGINVSDYIVTNAVAVTKGSYIEVKADKDIYNDGYYFRVTYPVAKTASKLAPKTPIAVYNHNEKVEVYSNTEKVTPAGNKILQAVVEDVLKDKTVKQVEIKRAVMM